MQNKFILDACCGTRMFWNDKNHSNVLYIDNRIREKGFAIDNDKREIKPDIQMDFRNMNFKDNSFKMVVFDPPHIIRNSEAGVYSRVYGILSRDTWKEDIGKGFKECWRVLDDYGTLIFKWSESSIKLKEVLEIINQQPLIKHKGWSCNNKRCIISS